MAAPLLPGVAFAGRGLVLQIVPVGEIWRRMYETRFPNPLGWGPGLSRFSDPTGTAFGLVYLGSSAKVAFVETVLRDRADGRGASDQPLARAWSAAFYAHKDQPDGVYYSSRLNEERCIALYDRALGKLKVTAAPRLMNCRAALAAILNELEISVV